MDLRAVPSNTLMVAAGQARVTALNIAANVATATALVRRAADLGAAVLVLPELFLTGYELSAVTAAPNRYAVCHGDVRLDPLSAACAGTGTVAVVGAATCGPSSDTPRISALVIDRDGTVAGRYDKQHLDHAERSAGFASGTRGCTVTVDGWRLGLGICWDSSFPEHARAAALDGCQGYLVCGMFDRGRGVRKRSTLCPARALDNTCYVVLANHCAASGPYDGCGGSAVWGPDGALIADAESDDPGLAVARFEPGAVAEARAADLTLVDPSLDAPAQPRRAVTLR